MICIWNGLQFGLWMSTLSETASLLGFSSRFSSWRTWRSRRSQLLMSHSELSAASNSGGIFMGTCAARRKAGSPPSSGTSFGRKVSRRVIIRPSMASRFSAWRGDAIARVKGLRDLRYRYSSRYERYRVGSRRIAVDRGRSRLIEFYRGCMVQ